jgi:hypothetical protein
VEPYPAVAVTGVTLPLSVDQISEEAESNAA